MPPKEKFIKEDTQTLKGAEVLQGLKVSEIKALLKRASPLKFAKNKIIANEGEARKGLYIVLEGRVDIYLPLKAPDGEERPSEIKFRTLKPGECFGEYSLLDEQNLSASIRALNKVRLFLLTPEDFKELVDDNDSVGRIIYHNMLTNLIQRLRSKDKELDIIFVQH